MAPDALRRRKRSLARLEAAGFKAAEGLPLSEAPRLRPTIETARRLLALRAVVAWVIIPEDKLPSAAVRKDIEQNGLLDAMTDDERAIIETPRDAVAAQYAPSIGWKMENMWPLAWALGFEPAPSTTYGQVDGRILGPLLTEFLPPATTPIEDFVAATTPRSAEEIAQLEDEFYCAHNAVRSAQLGATELVPPGFDPLADGGTVHERRHALTWILSAGIAWDDTDLST